MRSITVEMRSRISTAIWWAAFALSGALFCLHFTLTELGNLPENPIKVGMSKWINAYETPLFLQDWNFFAPNPIDGDITIFARVQPVCDYATKCSPSQWYDIEDPLIESIRRNRLSSLALIQLMLSNSAVELNNQIMGSKVMNWTAHGRSYWRPIIPSQIDPLDQEILERTSASAIRGMNPNVRFAKIQVGLRQYTFPRFSRRNLPDRQVAGRLFRTNWVAFPNDIAPFAPH